MTSARHRSSRVAEVVRALDAVQKFAADDRKRMRIERAEEGAEGAVDVFVFRGLLESFTFDGWTDDAVRAVVLAIATNAPTAVLDRLAKVAREENASTRAYRVECEQVHWPEAEADRIAKQVRDGSGVKATVSTCEPRRDGRRVLLAPSLPSASTSRRSPPRSDRRVPGAPRLSLSRGDRV